LVVPHDLILVAKVLGVALAVGLDVLAVSVGVGVMQLALNARLRLGVAFASSEIAIQVVGYELGAGAGKVLGEVATYIGLALLATIGCVMIRNSLRHAQAAIIFQIAPPQDSSLSPSPAYSLQVAGTVEVLGLKQSGPRLVSTSGTLIIAFGPACCSPLNGVGVLTLNPHLAASCGLLNQNPT
jgi:hypothetical protein